MVMSQTNTTINNGQKRNQNSKRGGWADEAPVAEAATIVVTIAER